MTVLSVTLATGPARADEAPAQPPADASSLERIAMPDGGEFQFLAGEETRDLYRQAFARLAPGPGQNPAAAVELARKGLDLEPDNVKGQLLYAEVLVRSGDMDKGLAYVREKSAANPSETLYKTAIAQIYFSDHKDAEAYKYLDEEIAKQPDNFELRTFRSDSRLFVSGDFDVAEKELGALVEAKPGDAQLWTSLGFARFQQGKLVSAKEAFHKALEIQPGYVEALNNLAWVAHKENRFADALKGFDEVIASRPDYRPAHLGRAYTLRDMGDLSGSIKQYKRLLELDPNFVLVLDMLVLYVRLYLWVIVVFFAFGLLWFGRLYLRTIRRDRRKAERSIVRR